MPDVTELAKGYTIDLDALLWNGKAGIFATARLVAYGLAVAESSTPESVHLPSAILQLQLDPEPSGSDTQKGFQEWLTGMGLRRYIEVYSGYLESIGTIASLVASNRKGVMRIGEWAATSRRMNRMSFPQKLDEIDSALGM